MVVQLNSGRSFCPWPKVVGHKRRFPPLTDEGLLQLERAPCEAALSGEKAADSGEQSYLRARVRFGYALTVTGALVVAFGFSAINPPYSPGVQGWQPLAYAAAGWATGCICLASGLRGILRGKRLLAQGPTHR